MNQNLFKLMVLMFTVVFVSNIPILAENERYSTETIETLTYGNTSYSPTLGGSIIGGSSSEHIMSGGTVFQVTYANGVDIRLKAAFELACRLWEENLPSAPTIKVKVSMASLPTTPKPVLSKVRFTVYDLTYECPSRPTVLFPLSSVKAILFMDKYCGNLDNPFYEFPVVEDHMEILDNCDFEVIYNSNLLDLFAFNCDNNHTDANKSYDFTTVAIRDIGKGLGFTCDFQADNAAKKMRPLNRLPLYYENVIISNLDYDYNTFTNNCEIPELYCSGSESTEKLTLATFAQWETGSSLCGFTHNSKVGLTKAMPRFIDYGSYLRNFSDTKLPDYCSNYLGWYGNYTTGINLSATKSTPEKTIIIPYLSDTEDILKEIHTTSSEDYTTIYVNTARYVSPLDDWAAKFYPRWVGDKQIHILRKDGSWHSTNNLNRPPGAWTIEDAINAEGEDAFARDSQGNIRGVIADTRYSSRMTYCVFEARPEPIELEKISSTPRGDNYLCSIGVKNAEGAENLRIVATIKKVGTTTSYTEEYNISNPHYRFFTITVPKNSNVSLTPYASNKNGETKGKTCSFPLYTPLPFDPVIKIQNQTILFESDEEAASDDEYVYNIIRYDEYGNGIVESGNYTNGSVIDISNLANGSYTLNYSVGNGEWKSFKFQH